MITFNSIEDLQKTFNKIKEIKGLKLYFTKDKYDLIKDNIPKTDYIWKIEQIHNTESLFKIYDEEYAKRRFWGPYMESELKEFGFIILTEENQELNLQEVKLLYGD